ncbi:hypothetical protein [Enterococcus phage vB_Efs4_KEN02]
MFSVLNVLKKCRQIINHWFQSMINLFPKLQISML